MSEIGLDVGLANDLKLAFRRHDYTLEQVHHLKEGEILGLVRGVLIGTHQIVPVELHTINLSEPCRLPFNEAERVVHRGEGVVKIEKCADGTYLDGERLVLFRSLKQAGSKVVGGNTLRIELERRGKNVSAKVLDHFMDHPELWPEEWKKKDEDGNTIRVFFWDDIFRNPGDSGLFVRYGYWGDGRVVSSYGWLGRGWDRDCPAATLAS